MVKDPLISVIIPAYNHASFLRKRIQSVLEQQFSDFELILLDDASTDESRLVFEEYRSNKHVSHIVFNATNSGSAFHQWKKGLELSRGKYVWIAESDDYARPDFLQKLVSRIERDKLVMGYCQSVDVNDQDVVVYRRIDYTANFKPNIWESDFTLEGDIFIQQYLKVKNVLPNSSAVVFDRVAMLNAFSKCKNIVSMKHAGDWLLWIHMCKQGKIGFIAEELNFFRDLSSSTRVHTSKEVLYRRLSEEKEIRTFLRQEYPELNQTGEWYKLSEKWFLYLKMRDIFSPAFYFFKPPFETKLQFIKRVRKYHTVKK